MKNIFYIFLHPIQFQMKKYLLALFFAVSSLQVSFSQGPPGPPGCECCAGLSDPDLTACLTACDNDPEGDYCSDPLPLDSNILVLLGVALSFGTYSVYQSRKRIIKN